MKYEKIKSENPLHLLPRDPLACHFMIAFFLVWVFFFGKATYHNHAWFHKCDLTVPTFFITTLLSLHTMKIVSCHEIFF